MQHYLVLSRGNFYAEKQHSNKVLHLALGGPVIMLHHVILLFITTSSSGLALLIYTYKGASFVFCDNFGKCMFFMKCGRSCKKCCHLTLHLLEIF